MIQSKPNAIPQYDRNTGGAFPRADAMKHKLPHERYQNAIKTPQLTRKSVIVTKPMQMLGQRNPLDQSLPSYKTPFDLRKSQSMLGGIAGFYGSSTQNGKPLMAQKGIGAYGFAANLAPRDPLVNRNF